MFKSNLFGFRRHYTRFEQERTWTVLPPLFYPSLEGECCCPNFENIFHIPYQKTSDFNSWPKVKFQKPSDFLFFGISRDQGIVQTKYQTYEKSRKQRWTEEGKFKLHSKIHWSYKWGCGYYTNKGKRQGGKRIKTNMLYSATIAKISYVTTWTLRCQQNMKES